MKYELKGQGLAIAKEMAWLAWQACGCPVNMGWLQNRPSATKEDVWQALYRAAGYERGSCMHLKEHTVDADYVFGRMMKLRFTFDDDSVTVVASPPTSEYQMWCTVYPTYEELVIAALINVEAQKK